MNTCAPTFTLQGEPHDPAAAPQASSENCDTLMRAGQAPSFSLKSLPASFAVLLLWSGLSFAQPRPPESVPTRPSAQLPAEPAPAPPRRPARLGMPDALAGPAPPRGVADRYTGWVSIEPRQWPGSSTMVPVSLTQPAVPEAPKPSGCIDALAKRGIVAAPATVAFTIPACMVDEPVRLQSVRVNADSVEFVGQPLLACAMALKVAEFVEEVAGPLMLGANGAALKKLHVGGGHECRPRNRVSGAKMSAHGRGLALDIMAVELSNGRRIAVSAETMTGGGAPLEGLRSAACGYFFTVLGPGSDKAHDDHLHLDIEQHGSSDRTRICQ